FTCSSTLILMSSPTSTPPVSNAWFQVKPNASREIFVSASKPTTFTPHGLTPSPVRSTLNVVSFVTSLIVMFPVTSYSSAPVSTIFVDSNVIFGYFLLRKSQLNVNDYHGLRCSCQLYLHQY